MRVSEHYNLGRTQPYLDFVDVRLDTDIEVFLDPSAIRSMQSTWGLQCAHLIQDYFERVLQLIHGGDDVGAQRLLSCLNERNEFHLGYSSGKSRGHAFGEKSAMRVWRALSQSKATKTGLLQDLEDTCLMLDGIGQDMISDAVCNIIRGPLIEYTQEMCEYYGIPMVPNVASGPIWNAARQTWEELLVDLPVVDDGKIILVPKIAVRHEITYRADRYYRHYLLPAMQQAELNANSGLVQLLKDGRKRVTKTSLIRAYGSSKSTIAEQTVAHPEALASYRQAMTEKPAAPLGHRRLSEQQGANLPDWRALKARLAALPFGTASASAYENLIEEILSALFHPGLCFPKKQVNIHEGRKRIDITYSNEATAGFFHWLAKHYCAPFIFIECKNYGKEIGNPELDQLTGRFSPSRGKFGILVCRSLENPVLAAQRCKDTAIDSRGYVLVLTDEDILDLIDAAAAGSDERMELPILRRRFNALVL